MPGCDRACIASTADRIGVSAGGSGSSPRERRARDTRTPATTTSREVARGARAIARSLLQLRRRESQPPARTYAAPGSPGILVPRRFGVIRQAQSSPNDDFAGENALRPPRLLRPCGGATAPRTARPRRRSLAHGCRTRADQEPIRNRSGTDRDGSCGAPVAPRRDPLQGFFATTARPRGVWGGAPAPRPSGARPPAAARDA